ncbi:IS3 family transposase [Nonomuraea sp. B10E15]|uniref:IS3 family transposase n=1 Tax=Nonomuraea sp. B10E15 TaxID=3153560 RepID=UPI00325C3E47
MRARFELIDAEKADHTVAAMCAWLGVSRSGYYEWRGRPASATARRREHLKQLITAVFEASRETYGYRRVRRALARCGEECSAELVRLLMRELGLVPVQARAFTPTTTEQGDFLGGDQSEQDRVAAFSSPLQALNRRAACHRGQEPAPLPRQHRHIKLVGVHRPQVQQLVDRHSDRRNARLDRRRGQPPKPGHPDLRVLHQQRIQIRPHQPRQQMRDLLAGQLPRRSPRSGHQFHERDRARPHYLRSLQMLHRLLEQQRWGVVLHRPVREELLQLLPLDAARRGVLPRQILHNQLQMIAARLRPLPRRPVVLLEHPGKHRHLGRQPLHRRLRNLQQFIRDEAEPRQRAQLNGQPQPGVGTAARHCLSSPGEDLNAGRRYSFTASQPADGLRPLRDPARAEPDDIDE